MRIPLLFAASAIGLLAATPALAEEAAKETSVYLDRLRLPTIDGSRTIDLATFRGEKLLLIEFASW